jgi:hypothetical protein
MSSVVLVVVEYFTALVRAAASVGFPDVIPTLPSIIFCCSLFEVCVNMKRGSSCPRDTLVSRNIDEYGWESQGINILQIFKS